MSGNGSNSLSLPPQSAAAAAFAAPNGPPPNLAGAGAANVPPQIDPAALSAIYASYPPRQPNDSRNLCLQLPDDTHLSVLKDTRQTFVHAHLPGPYIQQFYTATNYAAFQAGYPTPPHYAAAAQPSATPGGMGAGGGAPAGAVPPTYYYGMAAAGGQPPLGPPPTSVPHVNGAMAASPAAVPLTHPPTATIPRAARRSNAIPIVDPNTNEIVNRQHLESGRLPAASVASADSPLADETAAASKPAESGVDKTKEGKEIADVQHRFQDAVISKVLGQDVPQPTAVVAPAAAPTPAPAEAPKVWRATSVTRNDRPPPSENSAEATISLQDAVKERLAQAVAARHTSPSPADGAAATAAPEILVDGLPTGAVTAREAEDKSPAPSDEGKDTSAEELLNGASSPVAAETPAEKERRMAEEYGSLDDPLSDFEAHVYGSKFLHFMRNVVKELKHIACPKTDAELRAIGIDRAGMPAVPAANVKRYDAAGGKSTFLPPFMHAINNQSRVNRPNNYGGRHSDNKLRPKKPISGRTSMDRGLMRALPPPLESQLGRRAENAWRPSTRDRNSTTVDVDADTVKYEKLRKEFRGLLNKITPSTYEALATEFVSKRCYEDQRYMQIVIDLIFEKAVEEPHFCALYSDLCKRQVDVEHQATSAAAAAGDAGASEPRFFYRSILTKCQGTFLVSTTSDDTISRLEEELKSEELEPSRRDEIKEEIDRIKAKEKRRLNGIIRFIAELYRHNLLINPIINWGAVELVKRYEKTGDDVYIEYAVGMISKVGKSYEKRKQRPDGSAQDQAPIEVVFSHLTAIKSRLSNRVRFMIMDLEDLRRNNWEPKHGNTGPKTIEEVHNEVASEQLINQQEREAYEKKARESGGGGRKGGAGGKIYMGRGSTDSRAGGGIGSQTEKRSQAALNAIQTGSSSLRKDTDLKKVEDQQRLSSSRVGGFKWGRSSMGGGGGGGGAVESPLARNSTSPSGAPTSVPAAQDGLMADPSE